MDDAIYKQLVSQDFQPIVTTTQVTMWDIFNALGGGDTLPGRGRLLKKGEK